MVMRLSTVLNLMWMDVSYASVIPGKAQSSSSESLWQRCHPAVKSGAMSLTKMFMNKKMVREF